MTKHLSWMVTSTILFIGLFLGVQVLPLYQSMHFAEVANIAEDPIHYTGESLLIQIDDMPYDLFGAYHAYAHLTYKVPLANRAVLNRMINRSQQLRESGRE